MKVRIRKIKITKMARKTERKRDKRKMIHHIKRKRGTEIEGDQERLKNTERERSSKDRNVDREKGRWILYINRLDRH